MKIGILSDVHDQILNLKKGLEIFIEQEVEQLIFCGDFCSPFSAKELALFPGKIHAVYGNNDGDRHLISSIAASHQNFTIYGEYGGDEKNLIVLDGVRIAITHYPFYAEALARTGWFDAVFNGHTHLYKKQKFSGTLLLNPGEVAGIFNEPTIAVYNTSNRSSEMISI